MVNYKATALTTDDKKDWWITIYSAYKTLQEAIDGTARFAKHGYLVKKIIIEAVKV